MRTLFSVALTAAISSAEQAQQPDSVNAYDPASPLMQVRRLGEGLDLLHPHHHAPAEYVRDYNIPHAAYAARAHDMASDAYHRQMMHEADMEFHHPEHVIHSAEQPPPRVPHAFDERFAMVEETAMYAPLPKYHARGSHHAHSDFDKYGTLIDRHEPPTIRDLMSIKATEDREQQAATQKKQQQQQQHKPQQQQQKPQQKPQQQQQKQQPQQKPQQQQQQPKPANPSQSKPAQTRAPPKDKEGNFLEHATYDGHHGAIIEGVPVEAPAGAPVDFYAYPYHGDTLHGDISHEMHHHEAVVEDMNPDDSDLHHGPQLHTYSLPEHTTGHLGYEHHDAEHDETVDHGLGMHHDTELFHGHQMHHDQHGYHHAYNERIYHEPVVYHEHSHHSSQPLVHHTAPHVRHHPKVVRPETPVAEHEHDDKYHVLRETHHAAAPLHDYRHDVIIEEVPDEEVEHQVVHYEPEQHVDVHQEVVHTDVHHVDAEPIHEYPVFDIDSQGVDHYDDIFNASAGGMQQQDSLTTHEKWELPHAFGTQVIYGDHYNFRNDMYGYTDFPYDDQYFESYHYMMDGGRHLPPVPLNVEPELPWFRHDTEHGSIGCWVRTYVRGMGHHMKTCAAGEDFTRGKCFEHCKEGYTGSDGVCYQDCGTGGNTSSPFCHRPQNYGRDSSTQAKPGFEKMGLKYFSPCKKGYRASGTQCIGKCPEGTTDGGWMGCKKQTYKRESKAPACAVNTQVSGTKRSCYEQCPGKTSGHGPFCFGSCPAHTKSCFGIVCLPFGHKCTDMWQELASRVQRVIDAGMQTSWSRGMLHIGQLVGDTHYPTCNSWE